MKPHNNHIGGLGEMLNRAIYSLIVAASNLHGVYWQVFANLEDSEGSL